MLKHGGAAPLVELGHAVGLNVGLAGEPEFFLDCEFDGQAMAVPAGLAGHVVALHRAVTREDVLEGPRLDVVGPRRAVGGRGPLIEDPERAARRLGEGLGKDVALGPVGQHLPLHRGKVHLWRYWAVHVRLRHDGVTAV